MDSRASSQVDRDGFHARIPRFVFGAEGAGVHSVGAGVPVAGYVDPFGELCFAFEVGAGGGRGVGWEIGDGAAEEFLVEGLFVFGDEFGGHVFCLGVLLGQDDGVGGTRFGLP